MNYPCLVPAHLCKTDIEVTVYGEGLDENGGPQVLLEGKFKCNYQDNAKTVLTAEKKLIQLSGSALFRGDIAPSIATISGGTVKVFGMERDIFKGEKARNPDGTVNYTRIDVI
ncbi:hypothetical protein M2454_002934 [Aequitasia blattaphilus]|uniref:Uncharacterized protein n=1 Tax=Aequitasia blattaphilus TaxID=2949332 RepID=A0ABT1ED61_9FIRM|nr:hypothetical protein [Aequitasia blattaphilus]MCP1103601.1 hypothetical protein [Aequitasia blattaphilus]MCR8616241.1 hypothetical protein [Aequitasia blattaphilus]